MPCVLTLDDIYWTTVDANHFDVWFHNDSLRIKLHMSLLRYWLGRTGRQKWHGYFGYLNVVESFHTTRFNITHYCIHRSTRKVWFRRRLFDRFTWNTFANIMTHTHIHRDISWTYTVTENRSRQPVSPATTGGNMSCHNDNPGCHQRQPSRQIDDPPSSMIMDE